MLNSLLFQCADDFKHWFDEFCMDKMLGNHDGKAFVFTIEQAEYDVEFPFKFFLQHCKLLAAISTSSYGVKAKYCIELRTGERSRTRHGVEDE